MPALINRAAKSMLILALIFVSQSALATVYAMTEVPTYWRLSAAEANSPYTAGVSVFYGTSTKTNNGTTLWPGSTVCYSLQLPTTSSNVSRLFNFILTAQLTQRGVSFYYDVNTCVIYQFSTPQS
jgi:hypothetical protein